METLKTPEEWLSYAAKHFPWMLDGEIGLHIQEWLADPNIVESGCALIDNPVVFTDEP